MKFRSLRHIALSIILLNISSSAIFAQDCNSWIDSHEVEDGWYQRKKGITKYINEILKGNPDIAIEAANTHPGDAEAYFVKAVAYAHKGDNIASIENLNKSLDARLPFERYLTGPSQLMNPLVNMPEFKAIADERKIKLVHGPLLGVVTGSSAKFWVRTNGEMSFSVILSTDSLFSSKVKSNEISTSESLENTGISEVGNLKASTLYYYKLVLDGLVQNKIYNFKTNPVKGSPGKYSVAFGGGAAYIPWKSEIWNTISQNDVVALFQLGDNVYIDYPAETEVQQYCYYRRQSEPCYRDLISSAAVYAVWDDHDFGDDNDYGQDPKIAPLKPKIYETFTHQWNNPYYGGGKEHPGSYFDFSIADVDYFFLDSRYYKEKTTTMLGIVQKQWLKDKLKESTATFKVIASPVPFAPGVKPGSNDPWDGFPEERKEIFDYIADNQINGVVLIAADRHRHDSWSIKNGDSYTLHEFMSSKLTNLHTHSCMPDADWCTNTNAFGKLSFDTTLKDPTVTYEVYDIDNVKYKKSTTLKLSELTIDSANK